MGSTLGVKYDLILALRRQAFQYLRETFYRHAFEYLQTCLGAPAVGSSRKKMKRYVFPTETPAHCWLLWRPVVGGDTFSPLAPVLGPEQNTWLSPSCTVRGGQYSFRSLATKDCCVCVCPHALRKLRNYQMFCANDA